jgi:hypothetical protein
VITYALPKLEIHEAGVWKSLTPDHGIRRCTSESDRVTPVSGKEGGPREEGSGLRQGPLGMLDALLVPRDARGIVLLCGFVMAAALGIGALLVGDPIGFAFLAGAAIGYLFLQTRMLPALIFLAVAVYGGAGGIAGASVAWVECGIALLLTLVALFPVPAIYRDEPSPTPVDLPTTPDPTLIPANGQPSAFPEVSPTRSSTKAEVSVASSNGLNHRLVIQSIGKLRLLAAHGDLASDLDDKPVLAFMWKYLLARAASGAAHVSREAFGDELSPGMSKATQRERLRKQLYDLQNDIEPGLAAMVRANRSDVWLDLDDTDFDIASLRQLGEQIRQRGFLIDPQLAEEVRRMLQATGEHEFLAGFEELENKVTQARGTAGEVVAEARAAIANLRAELASALAEYHDAAGHPEAAIPALRAVLDALPQRQDLARLLVVAYLKTGQAALASEVRRNFDLKQE